MARKLTLEKKIGLLSEYKRPSAPVDVAQRAQKIPYEWIIEPNIPIGVYTQEAFNMHNFMQDDRSALTAVGLDWALVEEVPERIEYLRKTEAALWKSRFQRTPFEEQRELALKTRTAILKDLEFALAENASAMRVIRRIKKVTKTYDLEMDFSALRAFVAEHEERLLACGTDPQTIADVREFASKLIPALVEYNLSRESPDICQSTRNVAYTFLYIALHEIRRCAHHVFGNDTRKFKGYTSEYFRKSGKRSS